MKRRLSSGFALKAKNNEIDLEENDDESEKMHRLQEKQLAAAIDSDGPGTPTKKSSRKGMVLIFWMLISSIIYTDENNS